MRGCPVSLFLLVLALKLIWLGFLSYLLEPYANKIYIFHEHSSSICSNVLTEHIQAIPKFIWELDSQQKQLLKHELRAMPTFPALWAPPGSFLPVYGSTVKQEAFCWERWVPCAAHWCCSASNCAMFSQLCAAPKRPFYLVFLELLQSIYWFRRVCNNFCAHNISDLLCDIFTEFTDCKIIGMFSTPLFIVTYSTEYDFLVTPFCLSLILHYANQSA